MRLSEFDYNLPEGAIAQSPAEPRDSSKLLVLEKNTGKIRHDVFRNLHEYLNKDDLLVLNNTRVTARRIFGQKQTGGKIEVLLLKQIDSRAFEALARPAKKLRPGARIAFDNGLSARVSEKGDTGECIFIFDETPDLEAALERTGALPLPPYFIGSLNSDERYQTIYSKEPGSAAAPTAGLHFTPEVFESLHEKGIGRAEVTLSVGVDTFRPIKSDDISEHEMHGEPYFVPRETAEAVNNCSGRVIAVGTTVVRTLETAALGPRQIKPGSGCSSLFITPGYNFMAVDAMLTNFHMPRTTMLLLVSAMCGREDLMNAYEEALKNEYRFLSFGDSMLIIGETP